MRLNQISLKSRLIALTVVILVLVTGLVIYGQHLNTTTSSRNIDSSQVLQNVKLSLSKMNSILQVVEKELYEQIVTTDEDHVESIMNSYDILLNETRELVDSKYLKKFIIKYKLSQESNYFSLSELLSRVLVDIVTLKPLIENFNLFSLDVNKRYSAMVIFENVLSPKNKKINQLLDSTLLDIRISSKKFKYINTEYLLREAQYAWSQQIQSVMLLMSSRSGLFSAKNKNINKNQKKYILKFKDSLEKLKKTRNKNELDLLKIKKINNIIKLANEYDEAFERAKKIHLSDTWRNDVSILENEIQPQIDFVWEKLVKSQILISELTQESILLTQMSSEKISRMIWYSAFVILFVMLVIYMAFEFSLRRPIVAVASALDAEAKGESGPPINQNYSSEIIVLLNAFSNMRKQVKTRQTRLQSILDNSLESIVITNEQGIVESFNNAAENLFKYSSDEIVGKNVSALIPWPYANSHADRLDEYLKTGVTTIVGKKREVNGMNKNGDVFPVSIKVTEMIIEDKRYFTAVVEDISERKALIDDLQFQANHDSLTNLYNRLYFITELEKTVNQHLRGDSNKNAIIYLDLDNFKYVNDTMGHLAGDQLIKEVAMLLQKRIRRTDILARLGGDEFAILLFHKQDLQLEYVANCFREILSNYVFKYEGNVVDITCSIGAAYLNEEIKTKEDLLSHADFACHEAKRLGRNQSYIYSKSDDEQISDMSRDIGWTRRIREALTNENFILACQPILNTQSDKISYYEVLLRMLDTDKKIIMPFGFIPAAERFGLMLEIDAWVIRNSIKLLSNQNYLNSKLKLSINLSAHSIDNDSTFELIKNEIEKNKVNPENILFEVTETIAIANMKKATRFLKNIQSLGCETALDDFGVGYSSFAYLADLPIDVVKIDGFFVKDMHHKSLNKTMVNAINDIAHELGKKTVAEFVENQDIYNLLKELKVDYSQGYHLGKPEIVYDSTRNIEELFPVRHGIKNIM